MSLYKKFASNKAMKDLIKTKEPLEFISTGVITLNILFSGQVRGGIPKGRMVVFAAPSQSAKTTTALGVLKNAQKSGMECVIIDAEKRFDYDWARSLGIDTSEEKLLVLRTSSIIEIKQIIQELKAGKTRKERENTFVMFDSWGTIVSPTTIDKAEKGSDTRNMSEAVWKNELANIITESDLTYFVITHVYDNVGGYGELLKVSGGNKLYLNSDGVVMTTTKNKDKESKDSSEVDGFILGGTTHKGTKAIPKIRLDYRLNFKGGLDPWYGLLDDALEGGFVVKEGNSFVRPSVDDTKFSKKELYTNEFWVPIFKKTKFEGYLNGKYCVESEEAYIDSDDVTDLLYGKDA